MFGISVLFQSSGCMLTRQSPSMLRTKSADLSITDVPHRGLDKRTDSEMMPGSKVSRPSQMVEPAKTARKAVQFAIPAYPALSQHGTHSAKRPNPSLRRDLDPVSDHQSQRNLRKLHLSPDEVETIEAATSFLHFCRKVWTAIDEEQRTQVEVNSGQRSIQPRRLNGDHHPQRSSSYSSSKHEPLTPPGWKVSDRVPQPGGPPIFGMFTNKQEPITTSALQMPKKRPREQSLLAGPYAMQMNTQLPNGFANELRISSAISRSYLNENVKPSIQPRGGEIMSFEKQIDVSKRRQQDRMPLMPSTKAQDHQWK